MSWPWSNGTKEDFELEAEEQEANLQPLIWREEDPQEDAKEIEKAEAESESASEEEEEEEDPYSVQKASQIIYEHIKQKRISDKGRADKFVKAFLRDLHKYHIKKFVKESDVVSYNSTCTLIVDPINGCGWGLHDEGVRGQIISILGERGYMNTKIVENKDKVNYWKIAVRIPNPFFGRGDKR